MTGTTSSSISISSSSISSVRPRWFSSATATTVDKKHTPLPSELDLNLTPSQVVAGLDRHIVGQHDAKRAVAIAMRNRWRRKQLSEELRKEVTPRNVLLVGPTGCGKTEGASSVHCLDPLVGPMLLYSWAFSL